MLFALATNYSITWQRRVLLLKLLDIGRICGQIVLCYLQLSYSIREQVVMLCYLGQQSLRFFINLYRHSALQLLV